MPPPPPHHHQHDHPPPPKSNPKLLSSILKALIMTFITSIFFLILGFVAFLLFLILAAGALHRRRTHSDVPSSGFSPRHFKTLPQLRFRTQNQTTSSDCVVCLDAFRDGQWCRKLPACGHLFHRRCLDTWLVKVSACPICRTPVLGNTAADGLEEEEEAKRLWNFNRNTNSRVSAVDGEQPSFIDFFNYGRHIPSVSCSR
ncbi:RING-H2 finger protein ATL56-like isoform X2 [Argentina anserina]|uniref:RING-H2 finger protein ATL56-like isoform X2 n=1 Tax=Argentina anserina TaxID=57926 RepID=UPI0021764D32|nr:RING-H2 finger protein ATL56-like isoform X2 [Potentilla anserina]